MSRLPAGRPTEVPADRSSDPTLMLIDRLWLERRIGGSWTGLDGSAPVVHPGDVLRVTALAAVGVDIAEPVWGYLVRDRVGKLRPVRSEHPGIGDPTPADAVGDQP